MRCLCESESQKTLSGYDVWLTRYVEKRETIIVGIALAFNWISRAVARQGCSRGYGNPPLTPLSFTVSVFRATSMQYLSLTK